jgi:hypothetical protein
VDPVTAALVGWLVDRAATMSQRMLTRWLWGDKQANALHAVVSEAIRAAIDEMNVSADREAIEQALRQEVPGRPEIDIRDVLALRDAVGRLLSPRLAALADQGYRADADCLADAITQKIGYGIQLNAARGGPLGPVADLLRHEQLTAVGDRIAYAGERGAAAAEETVRVLTEFQASAPGSASVPSRPVSLAPRPAPLVGREQLLAQVQQRLAGGETSWPRVVALFGLGGAGKTSVALEYAHRHMDEYGVVWQFAAEDQATLSDGFAKLGRELSGQDRFAAADQVTHVHGILAARPDGWLLVFDNAADYAALRGVLPPAGHGHVIVTSQDPRWPAGQAVEVPMLDVDVAAEFLVNRTGAADRSPARDLARELGGLPLALEQAAAYMEATGLGLAQYLGRIRQHRAALLARGEPLGYDKRVTTTWSLAFGRLEQSAPSSVGLLRLLACCAPEAVPLSLLFQPRPALAEHFGAEVAPVLVPLLEDPLAAADAIAALRRYSLVTPVGDGSVLVHRLVQAVTADQMPADLAGQWRQAAAALIGAAIPADTGPPETWPVCAALLPHAQGALADDSAGMARLANYLGHRGSYAAAVHLQQRIAGARERALGPEHPDTLTARNSLASWTGQAGDLAGARHQFAALLPVMERVLSPEHPDTLTGRYELARWTGAAGEASGARDQYVALLPIRERVLGPEHPDTLTTRHNLAYWTGEAGDAGGARDQFAALLPVMARVLGPEHPDTLNTLNTRHNLARWTGEAGDAGGAREQFAALLPVMERVLGPEHPDTLNTRHNLARWTGEAGDAGGARDQYVALLPVRGRILGPEHPDTLTTRAGLAYWTGEAGDAAGARDQYAEQLPMMERVFGPEHPVALAARRGLAAWTEAGDAAGARDQHAALLPARERVSGPEHPDTLDVRGNLAYWTGLAGDAAGARDQYAALLLKAERVLGPEHPDTLDARGNLADWTGEAGDAAGARDQHAALLPVRGRILGPEHPETLTTRVGLASWTGAAGDAGGARDQFAALLPLMERVFGSEHPDTLSTRASLAYWTGQAGRDKPTQQRRRST